MDSHSIAATFWNIVTMIFFPLAIAVKNGTFFEVAIYILLLDLLILYIRKCLIPAIRNKNKNLLFPKLRSLPRGKNDA
jgi:hypothetical protein